MAKLRRRALRAAGDGVPSLKLLAGASTTASLAPPGRKASYATISHTLPLDLIEHLRAFAHYQRVSASSVIEFALASFFKARDDAALGAMLRRKGAGPRRKPKSP
ncbi:MAG TPA: hypothetical protein VKG05_12535 [Steroidobacteraceae bacterium]|nr:hypothetical protein [Steroidobacteraceae bacterium]